MRYPKQNPFLVESIFPLHLGATKAMQRELAQARMDQWESTEARKHLRYAVSPQAKKVLEATEIAPNIRVIWSFVGHRPGGLAQRGWITLVIPIDELLALAHSQRNEPERTTKVSVYTAHTILHRLGDRIFQAQARHDIQQRLAPFEASLSYYPLPLRPAANLIHRHGITDPGVWLPPIVDTKACREGWIKHGSQALAELVPYLFLYRKGREKGVQFRSFPARLIADPAVRAEVDASLRTSAAALTLFIERWVQESARDGDVLFI